MYELLASINDSISGKKVEQSIKEELDKSRSLSVGIKLEPVIVLEALRVSNKVKSYGLTDEQVDEMLLRYSQELL